ncbi:hypothetical protein Mal4_44160 [Maioricimonas rarisocia]|uniref:Calcineurin-like phosphoesterase domain-containing protein n=1 Tax=Maioricimonas rarisocia TaxID=2528026 RepID=A0A517ZC80_9PLAN|nr:ligase-associated DNA damage response endonuclease PdeM [Maioricimonas rarisocia]QDU40062.1 hypothetical protein Mal4_44160 [Maioricimonas rarisocia]
MRQGRACVNLSGEQLQLLPQRAVFHAATQTLFVADLHWGKTGTFRASAVPVSDGALRADLNRLSDCLAETRCRRLVVLGDLLHTASGVDAASLKQIDSWRTLHREIEILLVRGNHDRFVDQFARRWEMRVLEGPEPVGPFSARHEPASVESEPTLAGHLHPKVRLHGSGGERFSLPCFWLRANQLILPAFCSFVDGAVIRPASGDCVWAIADDEIIDVSRLALAHCG